MKSDPKSLYNNEVQKLPSGFSRHAGRPKPRNQGPFDWLWPQSTWDYYKDSVKRWWDTYWPSIKGPMQDTVRDKGDTWNNVWDMLTPKWLRDFLHYIMSL